MRNIDQVGQIASVRAIIGPHGRQRIFIGALEGEADPEVKRKAIGRLFIETFEAEAKKLAKDGMPAKFLAQGTHYMYIRRHL